MNYKTISTSKFDFLHFLKIIFFEFLYCFVIYYCYAVFSMLFFGEGASSFMYSITNGFIYLGLIILPPTAFNLYNFFNSFRNKQLSKSKNYILSQTILAIAFIWLLISKSPMTF